MFLGHITFQVRVWKWQHDLICPPIRWLIINCSCWMLICASWWFSSVSVASCWDFKQLFPPTRGHAAWKQIGTQFSSSGSRSWKGHGLQRHTEFWHCLMRSEQSHLCLIFWAFSKRQITQGHRWGLHIFFFFFFCFWMPEFYSLNPLSWKPWCLAQSIHLIRAD